MDERLRRFLTAKSVRYWTNGNGLLEGLNLIFTQSEVYIAIST